MNIIDMNKVRAYDKAKEKELKEQIRFNNAMKRIRALKDENKDLLIAYLLGYGGISESEKRMKTVEDEITFLEELNLKY
jgi:hypothetical protein